MPFKKGHSGYEGGGRKKGTSRGRGRSKNKQSLDVYNTTKNWERGSRHKQLDQEKVDYYIYNDLPLEELYDEMKLYDYGWKGESGSNLNSQAKKKKDNGNEGM